MMYEHAYYKTVTCEQCGKSWVDDCGDIFCSSRCEREWDRAHAQCEKCTEEVGESNLNENGLCEDCAYKEEYDL